MITTRDSHLIYTAITANYEYIDSLRSFLPQAAYATYMLSKICPSVRLSVCLPIRVLYWNSRIYHQASAAGQ